MDSLGEIEEKCLAFLEVLEGVLQTSLQEVEEAAGDPLKLLALDKPISERRELRKDAREALSRIATIRETEILNRQTSATEEATEVLITLREEIRQARIEMAQSARIDKIQALLISFAMSSKDEALIAQAEAIRAQSPTFHVTGQEKHETTIQGDVTGDVAGGEIRKD